MCIGTGMGAAGIFEREWMRGMFRHLIIDIKLCIKQLNTITLWI
jgi:hypothetical protein